MNINDNKSAQRLFEVFNQFRTLKWKHSSVKDLKASEFHLLLIIKKRTKIEPEGLKVSEISHILCIAPPTVTQVINGLEENGYVERTMDKADRRAVRVKLTEKGAAIMEKAHKQFAALFIGLAEYLGEEKSNELADLLSMVVTYLNKLREEQNNEI